MSPEKAETSQSALKAMETHEQFPLYNLIPEIVSRDNLISSIDYVIDHLENSHQRDKYRPSKLLDDSVPGVKERWDRYVAWREETYLMLAQEIETGEFTITQEDVVDLHVTDGPKERDVQAPRVVKRFGIYGVMVIVQKHTNHLLIHNTAASIKGRGMHWLHHILEEDLRNVPDMTQYYGQTDIAGYYDNIPQEGMKAYMRMLFGDKILLKILDSFIELMPKGLSKGLGSSQGLANLYLNQVHVKMLKEVGRYWLVYPDGTIEVRYLYYSYCDDTDFLAHDKKEAWRLMKIYTEEVAKLGLTVKPNYAVRPMTSGLDCLGYVHYRDANTGKVYSLLRKRIKQNAARKLARVQSRKRRQQIIGSFKGMACHADCKHLYYKLTHKRMKKFSEMGIVYTPADGKKRFPGKVVPIRSIANKPIEIHDYESDLKTAHGEGRYLVSFYSLEDKTYNKFFTASKEMQNILDQISDMEDGFPFETTIIVEYYDGKSIPKFT